MAETGPLRFVFYFMVGGSLVTAVALLTSLGRPQLAAFVGLIPSTTVLTFMFTYWEGGERGTVSYAKGMMFFTPAWLIYVGAVIILLPRLGLYKTLVVGVLLFFVASWLTNIFLKWVGIRM